MSETSTLTTLRLLLKMSELMNGVMEERETDSSFTQALRAYWRGQTDALTQAIEVVTGDTEAA